MASDEAGGSDRTQPGRVRPHNGPAAVPAAGAAESRPLVPQSPVPQGPVPEGSVPEGAVPEGAVPGGTAPEGAALPGAGTADRAQRRRPRSLWRELPVLLLVALVIALLVKTFVVQAFFIPSSSMEDTLLIRDRVAVSKLTYDLRSIEPGDIVVFNGAGSWDPAAAPLSRNPVVRAYQDTLLPLGRSIAGLFGAEPGQTDYIKRVIGVPGDHVACCNAQGLVTVNGVPLHEQSYLHPGETPGDAPAGYSGRFSITVPAGRLWVMGDNRLVSADSRLHRADPGGGTIPESMVIGRAFMIVWPPSRWRILPIPATFGQPGVDHAASAAGSGPAKVSSAAGSGSAARAAASGRAAAAALLRGVRVKPSRPYLPLSAGLAGALPLTWLQRQIRRRHARPGRGRRGQPGR